MTGSTNWTLPCVGVGPHSDVHDGLAAPSINDNDNSNNNNNNNFSRNPVCTVTTVNMMIVLCLD